MLQARRRPFVLGAAPEEEGPYCPSLRAACGRDDNKVVAPQAQCARPEMQCAKTEMQCARPEMQCKRGLKRRLRFLAGASHISHSIAEYDCYG